MAKYLCCSFLPLQELYFCSKCIELRCMKCVFLEQVSYFCPFCTVEVPSPSALASEGRCSRSCFECPQCNTVMSVCCDEIYYLLCPSCNWDSRVEHIVFENANGMGMVSQKIYEPLGLVQSEYNALVKYFETNILSETNNVLVPKRVKLQSKASKSCSCGNLVCLPELKATSSKFKILEAAWMNVPRIKIVDFQLYRFQNPFDYELEIKVNNQDFKLPPKSKKPNQDMQIPRKGSITRRILNLSNLSYYLNGKKIHLELQQ